ncbi:uncharacterized protein LOC116287924 [Actinia tenebrosa]|uniref:Uncharacterized protein LOC116287924 n=1 Tax=Actinia tenebrosa TaxID=6105 RepID=A0A6P8HCS4_ACTTE|nr:uncharacterized protein LOC116287924 [Actinia tenebrosa]
MCRITGPAELTYKIGETAQFKWSTSDSSAILSATWGIKKGNILDPQFINVDILRNKAYLNLFLEPNLMKRVAFEGDLNKGRAWFTLKNVTVNDTNVYIASISDYVYRVLPYTVTLTVKEREKKDGNIEPTKRIGPVRFPEIPRTTPTKDTESENYTKKDPNDPVNSNDHKVPIIHIAVPVAMVVPLVLIIAFLYKLQRKLKTRGTTPSEKKPIAGKVDV